MPFVVLLGGLIVVDAIVVSETRDGTVLRPFRRGIVVLIAGMALAVASANVTSWDVRATAGSAALTMVLSGADLSQLEGLPVASRGTTAVVDVPALG